MSSSLINTNPFIQNKKKILVITGDLPSHPYAAAKLGKVLATRHDVTLASPEGPAYDRIVSETSQYPQIKCITVGPIAPCKQQFNVRPVVDPSSWKTLWRTFLQPFFPLAQMVVQQLFDRQDGMYQPIKQEIETGAFDVVIPIHCTSITVCDAVESLSKTTSKTPKIIIFSALPYDPAFYLGEREAWYMPRSLTTFPHVATYSSNRPTSIVQRLVQSCWQLLDAYLTARAWRRSARYNNARRAQRGLPPLKDGWRGYFQTYPVLSFGGVAPFMDSSVSKVAPNVTVVGTLDGDDEKPTSIERDLQTWLDRQATCEQGIIYTGFGTGTVLSDTEAAAITGGLMHYSNKIKGTLPPVLFALRASEQKRLRSVFDKAMGASPTSESETHLEYFNGLLRIQDNVPQAALLKSGLVKVFISHMGMGGFVEGVKGGVPFVAYPSGCDQWFNAQRAVDAGIAVRAPMGLRNIGGVVETVLKDDDMAQLARSASKLLKEVGGEERAMELVESVAGESSDKSCNQCQVMKRQDTLVMTISHAASLGSNSFPRTASHVVRREMALRRQSSTAGAA